MNAFFSLVKNWECWLFLVLFILELLFIISCIILGLKLVFFLIKKLFGKKTKNITVNDCCIQDLDNKVKGIIKEVLAEQIKRENIKDLKMQANACLNKIGNVVKSSETDTNTELLTHLLIEFGQCIFQLDRINNELTSNNVYSLNEINDTLKVHYKEFIEIYRLKEIWNMIQEKSDTKNIKNIIDKKYSDFDKKINEIRKKNRNIFK